MLKQMDKKAQGGTFLYLMLFMMVMFIMMMTGIGETLAYYFSLILNPLIGFSGKYPILTLFFAGLIVVFFSSLLTNFFTDWKRLGESQETTRVFQQEIQKARKEGNTNRVNKLMKMQPEIMKKQTEASGGMMKPMIFLIIFIWPIFIWLRADFLYNLSYPFLTVPWASQVSLFSKPFLMQAWLWLYLIFSIVIGQLIRQGLKYLSWTEWWKNVKKRIRPSSAN
jgi:uncharacterized membrane protein (DUF106 family)